MTRSFSRLRIGPAFLGVAGAFVLLGAFCAWVAGGHEASDSDGNGATTAFEAAVLLAGPVLVLAATVWGIVTARALSKRGDDHPLARVNRAAISQLAAAAAVGAIAIGAVLVIQRAVVEAPNKLDYVTGVGLSFIAIGVVALALVVCIALRRRA